MAISAVHYQLLKEHAPLLNRGGSLLEIGEANWYGDMEPPISIGEVDPSDCEWDMFAVAKAIYRILWNPRVIVAVDMNGTPSAMRQDLNAPLQLAHQYDTIINHGTAEHIFNIGQVFASIHDACKVGGYMIHESPFTGWPDHGFYTIQPTLFYDLSAANHYELVSLSMAEIASKTICRVESREHCHELCKAVPQGLILFVVLRKAEDQPFRVPMQGYYDGRLSPAGMEAWHGHR